MKRNRTFRQLVVTLSILAMFAGQLVHAAGPVRTTMPTTVPAAAAVGDVALQDQGILQGQFFDEVGAPAAGVEVLLLRKGERIAQARTDQVGRFALRAITPGVYELATPESRAVYRLWAAGTAPPAAQQGVLVVSGQPIVRGAPGGHHRWMKGLGSTLANPWILALIVAAAIAIPLAVDSNNDSAS